VCLGLCKAMGSVPFLGLWLLTYNSRQIDIYDSMDCKDVVAHTTMQFVAALAWEFMEAFNV
jgi:hypothetical protein